MKHKQNSVQAQTIADKELNAKGT